MEKNHHIGTVFVKEDRKTEKVVQKPCSFIAKFHYTGPTGPARTFFAAKLRWVRAGRRQSPCVSGRVRVVEFSYYATKSQRLRLRLVAR